MFPSFCIIQGQQTVENIIRFPDRMAKTTQLTVMVKDVGPLRMTKNTKGEDVQRAKVSLMDETGAVNAYFSAPVLDQAVKAKNRDRAIRYAYYFLSLKNFKLSTCI